MMLPGKRRGALLPAVLAAMVIIGLAASAAVYIGRGERAVSANALLQAYAASSGEEAEVVGHAALAARATRLAVGEGITDAVSVSNTPVRATARLTRLGPTTFVLSVDAHAADASGRYARRRSSLLLRLDPPRLEFPAALALTGSDAAPAGVADGADHPSTNGDCEPDSAPTPDVLHPFAAAADSTELQALRDRAAVRLAPGALVGVPGPVVRDGSCDTARPSNWGDPSGTSSCASWLPIVYAPGDLTVIGGAGQGTLLVDGDLDLSGGVQFAGAVVVGGTLTIGPGGARVSGGVRAAEIVDAAGASVTAPSIVRSSCALRAALIAAGRLVRAGERPWGGER